MNRLLQTLLAATLLLVAAPSALRADQNTPQGPIDITFETVDAVEYVLQTNFVVTGVPQGQDQAQELQFHFGDVGAAEQCHKQAVMAMEHAGHYALRLKRTAGFSYWTCKLIHR